LCRESMDCNECMCEPRLDRCELAKGKKKCKRFCAEEKARTTHARY
jgi:hypothetical protein